MKDPYAPGFWCSVTILGTLTAGYFYGIRHTQQMNQAVQFLYAAAAVTAGWHCAGWHGSPGSSCT